LLRIGMRTPLRGYVRLSLKHSFDDGVMILWARGKRRSCACGKADQDESKAGAPEHGFRIDAW
jgi:hypothetical protein